MNTPQAMLDKALVLIDQHLTQLRTDSTTMDEKGKTKALSAYDSQVIERYTKLLITLTKKDPENLDGLSDAELEDILNGQDNVSTTLGDDE